MSRFTTVRVRADQLLRGASPTHNERTALEELSSYGYVMRQYDNAQAVWSLNPEQARSILAKHTAPQPAPVSPDTLTPTPPTKSAHRGATGLR